MKRFLLANPENKKWVEAQEKRLKAASDSRAIAKLVRREMFPQLAPLSSEPFNLPASSSVASDIVIEARQRQLHRRLMKELEKSVQGDGKGKLTTTLYQTKSWELKAKAIFFYFHTGLWNLDEELTCSLFTINVETFKNWIRQKQYFAKWAHYVQNFEARDVLQSIPEKYQTQFSEVDPLSKVALDTKYRSQDGNVLYVSATSSGNRQLTKKMAARNKDAKYILKSTKTIGSGRKDKYEEQEFFIVEQVVVNWETGNPLSKATAYDKLISKFANEDDESEFSKAIGLLTGRVTPALSQWLAKVLERHRLSIRKESISQSVPRNWLQICLEATALIRESMKVANVTRLVNADEMFLQFYPRESHLIVPTNTKRVGSNRVEDEKKGCLVMVSCEMFTSQLVAPFVVMTGTRDGTLSRRFADWNGVSKVTFHPKHWMDKQGACLYLDWLCSCFRGEKIGLIWDAASSHFCEEVTEKARALNITLGAIPPGCTSLIQVCDLIVNKPRRYAAFKARSDPGVGGKYKVERSDVLTWLEQSLEEVNEGMSGQGKIVCAFAKYGQDFRVESQELFAEYLAKNEENGVYRSLIDSQRALDLDS